MYVVHTYVTQVTYVYSTAIVRRVDVVQRRIFKVCPRWLASFNRLQATSDGLVLLYKQIQRTPAHRQGCR